MDFLWLIVLGIFIFFATIDIGIIRFLRNRIKGLESALLRIKKNKRKVEEKYQASKEECRRLKTELKEARLK